MFQIHLSNITINSENVLSVLKDNDIHLEWEIALLDVLKSWFSEDVFLSFQTSGSTGTPKVIRFTKDQIRKSAELTASTFKLDGAAKVLLCLHPKYVAGQMMILRAIINDWKLCVVSPGRQPVIENDFDFSAMVPMQLESLLSNDSQSINRIGKLIIGGAPISEKLHRGILKLKTSCFATYGMTETLTHIAVKKLNGNDAENHFSSLKGVELNMDINSCLNIKASHLGDVIQTNDVVDFVDFGKFIWKGRIDNVINSGGVKIHPEVLEKKIEKIIDRRFYFIGMPDNTLGEKLILCIEGEEYDAVTMKLFKSFLEVELTKYEVPKEIVFVNEIKATKSRKIIRELPKK